MAARELVLLSSSPPCIPDSDIVTTPPALHAPRIPSLSPDSPALPSPSELFKRKPPGLKSGSRAAEIPNGATLGFASAAALVRDRLLSLEEDDCADEGAKPAVAKDQAAASKRPTKRPPKQPSADGGTEAATKKPSRRRAKGQAEPVSPETGTPDVDVPATKTTKRRTKANSKDPDHGVPTDRQAEAVLNDSALTKEALGRDPEEPASHGKSIEGGAVEKLKKLKGRPSTIVGSPAAVDDVVCLERETLVPEQPKKQKPKAPRAPEKKPRAKRKKLSDQELAKPAAGIQSGQPSKKNARPAARMGSETSSKHFSRDNSIDPAAAAGQDLARKVAPQEPLQLEPAMMRRLSWTPPKDTRSSPNGPDQLRPTDLLESPVQEDSTLPAANTSFTSLLQTFGYNEQASGAVRMADPRAEPGEAFAKRRKLEVTNPEVTLSTEGANCSKLVDKPNKSAESSATGSREQSPEKPEKAPRKKPRTITDLATAAYRAAAPALPAGCPPVDPTVSAFFVPRNGLTSAADSPDVAEVDRPKRAVRQKSPTKKAEGKAKKTNAKSKKALKLAAEKLLSPETALVRMSRQDVLFGTSSQLAREDSPTFIRDIQQALRDSESTSTQRGSVETLHLKPAVAGSGLSLVGRRRGLWAVASRDLDDGILEEEEAAGLDGNVTLSVEDSVVFLSDAGAKTPSPTHAQTAATFIDASKSPGEVPAVTTEKLRGSLRLVLDVSSFSRISSEDRVATTYCTAERSTSHQVHF
ncbi:Structure-specific endonuclease subunit slx4 [Neofusicoccum parvum]|uniref:Structure-specific endonuclease subunit slx4 n=1 Tax=Neofusicoccum parvum TaxID=310453 RepID=A0ACB5SA81_9PEZI|nr:Structure-specific endonuclease subunit slx4 [Neofusicoccum parvum]